MSEEINNREYRQKIIKELIGQLHEGKSVDEVKQRFAEAFEGVSAQEISQAEQALIADGLPVAEVQRLCDVHAAVFKGSIEEIHRPTDPAQIPGHPAHTLKMENRALEKKIEEIKAALERGDVQGLKQDIEKLWEIDRHYLKKENLLFPYLEQYGITAPPKVMWGVDDEIRAALKQIKGDLARDELSGSKEKINELLHKIGEMIFKEENILLPMLIENLTVDEWKRIVEESGELGYCLIDGVAEWRPAAQEEAATTPPAKKAEGELETPTGSLNVQELIGLLNTLPVDITFVDKEGTVKYFSQNAERIFPRTKAVIGRKVTNCHPPASVHIVEKIVEDLRSGAKDHEDFWIKMGGKYVYIRYFAVRDPSGEFLGVLEVTQNIAPIQELTGEKRLVSE